LEKTQKPHFVGFARNFQILALLTLEMAEGVAVDPHHYRSLIGNQGQKIYCACFRHISTSGFRETGHFECFFSANMHGAQYKAVIQFCVTGSLGDRKFMAT